MSTKLKVAAVAAAMTALLTPALTSAMTTAPSKVAPGKVLSARGTPTPVVVAPDGRVLGTDPSAAVRFELTRDSSRGR